MLFNACQTFDQIFTHQDSDGVVRHINASAIVRAVKEGKIPALAGVADIPPEVAQHVEMHHGVDEKHLPHVEEKIDSPILMVKLEDGHTIVVDGNHRLVLRYRKGLTTVRVALVESPHWQDYMISDMPDEVSNWAVQDALSSAKAPSPGKAPHVS